MKLHRIINHVALAAIISTSGVAAEKNDSYKVIFSPHIEGRDKDGLGVFVRDVIEASLTDHGKIELIDRSKLATTLSETAQSEVKSSSLDSQLKVSGANYAVYPKMSSFGKNVVFTFRVVDLATSAYRSSMVKATADTDPMVVAKQSTEKIMAALEIMAKKKIVSETTPDRAAWSLSKDKPRFKVALRIPESSTRQQNPDPAGEKELSSVLLANKFSIIQLSRPSQSTTVENAVHLEGKEHEALLAECRKKGVEIIILGIAASDRATQIGSYCVASARIELSAVRVSDSVVLSSAKGYGKATDMSALVAEKKAIENAVQRLAPKFIEDMVTTK